MRFCWPSDNHQEWFLYDLKLRLKFSLNILKIFLLQIKIFSDSLRSPEGPMRGRSVKEFEETLAALKKENFNLKIRIYFLEERMGANFNLDKENILKKNVELMVRHWIIWETKSLLLTSAASAQFDAELNFSFLNFTAQLGFSLFHISLLRYEKL